MRNTSNFCGWMWNWPGIEAFTLSFTQIHTNSLFTHIITQKGLLSINKRQTSSG